MPTVYPKQASEVFLRTQRDGFWVVQDIFPDELIVRFLAVENTLDFDLTLSVDDKVVADLFKQKLIEKQEIDIAIEWIKNQFVFDNFVFTQIFDNRQDENHFVIVGKEKTAQVLRQKNGVWQIKRITPLKKNIKLLCLKGNFDILDQMVATKLQSTSNQLLLDASIQEYGDYLRLWNEYSQLELKKAKEQARTLGFLPYGRFEVLTLEDKRYRLFCDKEKVKEFYQIVNQLNLANDTLFDIYDEKFDWQVDSTDDLPGAYFRGKVEFYPTENYVDFIVNPNFKQRSEFF